MTSYHFFNTKHNMDTVTGDLISSEFQDPHTCIVQILNCVAVRPHGLSETLAKKYPYSDLYSKRRSINKLNRAILEDRPTPGTMDICRSTSHTDPLVANLYAQFYMGKDNNRNFMTQKLIKTLKEHPDRDPQLLNGLLEDTTENRVSWFYSALIQLLSRVKEENIKKIVFPFRIGCGLAGGNWRRDYLPHLKAFHAVALKKGVVTVIVQKK